MNSNSFSDFDGLSVAYINHEGVELPLNNLRDFKEAIWSAKWKGKNRLDLIFYDHKLKAEAAAALNNNKFALTGRFSSNQEVPFDQDLISNNSPECIEAFFEELLKQNTKKFKQEILKDLKTIVKEIIQEEFEKRKKLEEAKLFKPSSHKNEFSPPKKFKKKKKKSDKEGFDIWEKGDTKLLKKIEKLHSFKFDKMMVSDSHLEKLVNRCRTCPDDKRKLLEKIHQIKLKEAKKTWEHDKKSTKSEKSAEFFKNNVFLFLQPGAEFSVTVNILNNGTVPWVSPHMECFKAIRVLLQEPVIELPRLKPGQSFDVTLRGKVSKSLGNHYFAYKIFDGLEELAALFWCCPVVSDSKKEVFGDSSGQPRAEKITFLTENLVDAKINFEKDVVENSQKKIKENMIEIEKSLRDLHFIKFCNENKRGSLNNTAENLEIRSCNSLQDKEKKYCLEKLEEEGISGVDALLQQEELTDAKIKCKNIQTNKYGEDSDSDSDLSIIFSPGEDENFSFVPFDCKCSNPETSFSSTNLPKVDTNKEFNEASQKTKKDVEVRPAEVDVKEVSSEESSMSRNCSFSSSIFEERLSIKAEPTIESCSASAKASSGRVISDESGKKNIPGDVSFDILKEDSPRGNYGFSTSTEDSVSHSAEEMSSSRNTKSEEDTKASKNDWVNIVERTDGLNTPIYAVKEDGCCFLIEDVIENKAENLHSNTEKRERFSEDPNYLYNFYSMGAEEREYVETLEDKEEYISSMLTLHEMGFVDGDLNFRLLKKHGGKFVEVLYEILDMPAKDAT